MIRKILVVLVLVLAGCSGGRVRSAHEQTIAAQHQAAILQREANARSEAQTLMLGQTLSIVDEMQETVEQQSKSLNDLSVKNQQLQQELTENNYLYRGIYELIGTQNAMLRAEFVTPVYGRYMGVVLLLVVVALGVIAWRVEKLAKFAIDKTETPFRFGDDDDASNSDS